VQLNGTPLNRRDAMDAEEDGAQSPEGVSLSSGSFDCPLPRIFLCTAKVAIARKLRRFRVQMQETDRIMAGQNHAEQEQNSRWQNHKRRAT